MFSLLERFTDSLEKFAAQYSHEILSCLVLTGLAFLLLALIVLIKDVRQDFKVTEATKQ